MSYYWLIAPFLSNATYVKNAIIRWKVYALALQFFTGDCFVATFLALTVKVRQKATVR